MPVLSFPIPSEFEKMNGDKDRISNDKTDIFNLGKLLYYCLFGDLPFEKTGDFYHQLLFKKSNNALYFQKHRATR